MCTILRFNSIQRPTFHEEYPCFIDISPVPVNFIINFCRGEGPLLSASRIPGSLPHFLVSETLVMSTLSASKVSRGHANATPSGQDKFGTTEFVSPKWRMPAS